jgi:hypothetical protein
VLRISAAQAGKSKPSPALIQLTFTGAAYTFGCVRKQNGASLAGMSRGAK